MISGNINMFIFIFYVYYQKTVYVAVLLDEPLLRLEQLSHLGKSSLIYELALIF